VWMRHSILAGYPERRTALGEGGAAVEEQM